jgi:hypothetical protein
VQAHIAESYRDPETRKPRHRLLLNISWLPAHVIEASAQSLKQGKAVLAPSVAVKSGDALRGAGIIATYRAWQRWCGFRPKRTPIPINPGQ